MPPFAGELGGFGDRPPRPPTNLATKLPHRRLLRSRCWIPHLLDLAKVAPAPDLRLRHVYIANSNLATINILGGTRHIGLRIYNAALAAQNTIPLP